MYQVSKYWSCEILVPIIQTFKSIWSIESILMVFLGNTYAKWNPKRNVLGLEQTCSLLSGTVITIALFWLCMLLSWPFRSYLWARDGSVLSRPTVPNGEEVSYSVVQTTNSEEILFILG